MATRSSPRCNVLPQYVGWDAQHTLFLGSPCNVLFFAELSHRFRGFGVRADCVIWKCGLWVVLVRAFLKIVGLRKAS